MLQIRTTVQGVNKFLDIYQDEPVLLNLSFAELQDITKKNSAFSKPFALPGSKKNNEIFNYFYNLNSIPTNFNPNDKFEAALLWDGYELFQGNIRLDGVTIAEGGEIIYNVTFYNQVGDLMANIGDKFLYNTNLVSLSHPYQKEVVLKSIYDPTLFPLTGATNYSYENGETFWGLYNIGYEYLSGTTVNQDVSPFIQFSPILSASTGPIAFPTSGNFDFSGTPVHDYYFKPTIQVKALYESIVSDAGYEISSDFFNTDYFKHFYLPLKFLDETIYAKNAILACYKYGPQSFPLDIYTPVFTNPSSGVTCNSLNYSANTTTLQIPSQYAGDYTFRFTFTVLNQGCNYPFIPFVNMVFRDGFNDTSLYFQYFCDQPAQEVSFTQQFILTGTSNMQFIFSGDMTTITNFVAEIVQAPRFIPSGTTIDYAEEFPTNDYTQIDFITSVNRYFNLLVVPNPDKPKQLIIEPLIDYVGKGRVLDWTSKIDYNQPQSIYPTSTLINGTLFYDLRLDQDYTNQDFKSQANRTFGTDKFKLNLPYKDAETKFDYLFSSPIDITVDNAFVPLITVPSMSKVKTVEQQGTSSQTFVPFKILPRLIFRGPTLPQDNWGFVGGVQTVSGNPNCTSGVTINITDTGWIKYNDCFGVTSYQFYNTTGSKTISGCINPNTVAVGVPYADLANFTLTSTGTTCGTVVQPAVYQSWYIDQYEADVYTNLNRFTTYPFNYLDFSHYCNYRGEDKTDVTPAEFTFVAEDLYDIYYKPYIDDLTSEESKILKAKIYLFPNDIQSLRWNEKILIGNTYFRINSINNFNALEPGICDIELVKLTKEYEPHRVLYYDLIPCSSGGTVYHSHSDLMYHLYLYAGNYVRLFDNDLNYLGCYGVSVGTYNSSYTYEHFYLSSGYTNINLINVYPDCGCTGRTETDLVQQTLPTPTPSVTPTLTMTPTPSGCFECYEYSFTATTAGLVQWYQCDGTLDFTNATLNEVLLIQCARQGSISGTGVSEITSYCGGTCPTPTPTTSSNVTPTPTPTKTLTPTPSQTSGLTPTPTPTNTGTPTPTPSITASPTITPTITNSPTISSTPTTTPTPTPTSGTTGCMCYWILNETGSPIDYQWDDCVLGASTASLGGGASAYVCAVDLPSVDPGGTITPCGVSCTTTCLPCA